jgi:large subunit ribosomal protein L11
MSRLILKKVGIESGSKVPNRDKVGKLKRSDALAIARIKMPDLRVHTEDAAVFLVMGTARSMGVDIIEG